MSDRNRRAVKIVKIKDDGIYIEKALKSKNLRIPWGKISLVSPTKEIKDGLKIDMYDGKYVVFITHIKSNKLPNTSLII